MRGVVRRYHLRPLITCVNAAKFKRPAAADMPAGSQAGGEGGAA
jgi:hypothetical protein